MPEGSTLFKLKVNRSEQQKTKS